MYQDHNSHKIGSIPQEAILHSSLNIFEAAGHVLAEAIGKATFDGEIPLLRELC